MDYRHVTNWVSGHSNRPTGQLLCVVVATSVLMLVGNESLAQSWPSESDVVSKPMSDELLISLSNIPRNWGHQSSGLCLGAALNKMSYQPGEPIYALVSITNASDKLMTWTEYVIGGMRTDLELIVIQADKSLAPTHRASVDPIRANFAVGKNRELSAAGVTDLIIRLDTMFSLRVNQSYTLYAKKRIQSGPKLFDELVSGNALFQITGNQPMGVTTPLSNFTTNPDGKLTLSAQVTPAKNAEFTTVEPTNGPVKPATTLAKTPDKIATSIYADKTPGHAPIRDKNPQLAVSSPADDSRPAQRWFAVVTLALLGLIGGILLNAARRRRAAAGSLPSN